MVERAAKIVISNDGAGLVTWSGLLNGDTGADVNLGRVADKSVHVVHVAAGSGDAVAIEGSNDGGTTYVQLNDPQGSGISFGAAGTVLISENLLIIRPRVTAGDGTTNFTVHISFAVRA